jgi:hypothetical protein
MLSGSNDYLDLLAIVRCHDIRIDQVARISLQGYLFKTTILKR